MNVDPTARNYNRMDVWYVSSSWEAGASIRIHKIRNNYTGRNHGSEVLFGWVFAGMNESVSMNNASTPWMCD